MYEEDAIKLFVQGGKPSEVNITDKDFLAEGGEGRVYLKGKTVYKVYIDPSKMINPAKIDELQTLKQPNILSPKNVLLNDKGVPIGYTMDAIVDSTPLCKLFTNDFRNRFNIDDKVTMDLVKEIQKGIDYVHKCGCIMVDGNEMNYLVDKTFKVPYFIDVDSWQTKSFPATAIMASIRDHHTKGFSELTDWFGFAVIATQLFVGIHPYKGTHDQFKKSDMEGRMKANISIFNKDVRLPSAVRPLDNIPSNYKEWLVRVLEKGERLLPPTESGTFSMMTIKRDVVSGTVFVLELITDYGADIIRAGNGYVTLHGVIHKDKNTSWTIASDSTEVVRSPLSLRDVLVKIEDGLLMYYVQQEGIMKSVAAEDKMLVGNSVFIKNEDRITEVVLEEFSGKISPFPKSSWNIMPNSTRLFNGLIYQNILGTPWLMIPYEISGKRAMFQKMIPELKGANVLEAKYENLVAMVVAERGGKYESHTFKFDESFSRYCHYLDADTDYHIPNFVVLDNGVCIRITPDDEVHIFSNRVDKPDCKVLKDKAVTFEMKLCHNKMEVQLRHQGKLYRFKTK